MKWKSLLLNTFLFFALTNVYTTPVYALERSSLRELGSPSASAPSAATDWWLADPTTTLTGHKYGVSSAEFSPDGKWIASAGDDGTIQIWDAASGGAAIAIVEAHDRDIWSLDFNSDGTKLVSGSFDGKLKIWNVGSGGALSLKNTIDVADSVYVGKFSPDGKFVASGGYDKKIRIWREDGVLQRILPGHTDGIHSLAFKPNSDIIASGSSDNTVRLWDIHYGTELGSFAGHTNSIFGLDFTPDGYQLASGSWDNTIIIWNFNNDSLIRKQTINAHDHYVQSVAFSPDGKYLASGSWDKSVKVWKRTNNYELVVTFNAHADYVGSVQFSPDSQKIASASEDSTICIWGKLCKPGQYGSPLNCKSCAPGTFTDERGMDKCIPCGAGTFQVGEGAEKCVECVAGGFCPGEGTDGSGFTLCPTGTYNDMKGETNEASCTKCTIGSYNDIKGGINEASCIKCPIATFQKEEGAEECVECAVGGFCPGDGTDGSGFTLCPSGMCNRIKGGTNEASCTKCIALPSALGMLWFGITAGTASFCVLFYFVRHRLVARKAKFVILEAEANNIAVETRGVEFGQLT